MCALTTDGPAAVRFGAAMALRWRGRSPGATKYISSMNCSTSLEYTLAQPAGGMGEGGREVGRDGGRREGGREDNGGDNGPLHMDTGRWLREG